MDPSRRRTLASSSISQIPTSVSRPTAASRQSLAPTSSTNNRQSLAPARSLGASRQSLAPSGSQELAGSQGSQLFPQGHGGPVREAPMTGGRSNMYSSMGSASVGRSGVLKSSHVDAPYAPPRLVGSSPAPYPSLRVSSPSVNDAPRTIAAQQQQEEERLPSLPSSLTLSNDLAPTPASPALSRTAAATPPTLSPSSPRTDTMDPPTPRSS